MSRKTSYSAEFKAKFVLDIIQGNKTLNEIAAERGLNPNMLRNWRKEFTENASRVFNQTGLEKEARRKEDSLEQERDKMLKTIGQLTLERDFLQDCFRKTGIPVPELDQSKR